MKITTIASLLFLAGCTDNISPSAEPDGRPTGGDPPPIQASNPETEPYPSDLRWMLERAAPEENPATPCLVRPVARPAWVNDSAVNRRLREVRSDSYWLGRWARDNLGERLAYAEVVYDFGDEPVIEIAASPPRLIYVIAVTGSEPITPPPLGGRAKDVPVIVRYERPIGHAEFMRRREVGGVVARRLIDTTGEGGSPGGTWAVRLGVFSADGRPDHDALAHCDELRRAYRLPVLMEFQSARPSH